MEKLAIEGGKPVRKNNIPMCKPFLGEEEIKAATDVIRSTFVSGDGPVGEEFESRLAKYLGVKYAFFVSSCTAALHASMMAAGIESGEVITPSYNFPSAGMVPLLVNASPIFVDVKYDTCNIDPNKIREKITAITKAIIVVHYAGQPCEMDEINAIAKENNVLVIEDAAQAIGSEYKGNNAGNLGDIGCFSFHGTKNIVCGEGGALVTNNDEFARKVPMIRLIGQDKKSSPTGGFYYAVSKGHSFVQSEILAAIALEQLKKLDKINKMRTKNATYLSKKLGKFEEITLPYIKDNVKTNWHIYAIKIPESTDISWFKKALIAEGIDVNVHYIPLNLNPLFQSLGYKVGEFPVAEKIYKTLIRFPMYPQLTKEEMDDIVYAVEKVLAYLH